MEKLMSQESKERTAEINALTTKLVGLLNSLDSKSEKAQTLQALVDGLIAGADISKIEKAGILAFVAHKRSQ